MAKTSELVDLKFIARQQELVLTELGGLRGDMSVLTSIVLRQDDTLTALLQETQATQNQIQRMNDRVFKLEIQSTTT